MITVSAARSLCESLTGLKPSHLRHLVDQNPKAFCFVVDPTWSRFDTIFELRCKVAAILNNPGVTRGQVGSHYWYVEPNLELCLTKDWRGVIIRIREQPALNEMLRPQHEAVAAHV